MSSKASPQQAGEFPSHISGGNRKRDLLIDTGRPQGEAVSPLIARYQPLSSFKMAAVQQLDQARTCGVLHQALYFPPGLLSTTCLSAFNKESKLS